MARLYNLHAGHALAGIAAVMAGHQVKYVMATKLVNEFLEAVDELILTQTFARYGRLGLLSIDELGSLALGPWPLAGTMTPAWIRNRPPKMLSMKLVGRRSHSMTSRQGDGEAFGVL